MPWAPLLAPMLAMVLAALTSTAALSATMNRTQALAAIAQADPVLRLTALLRLGEVGTLADADAVLDRLADTDPRVRIAAASAAWQIWGRSGDPATDALYAQGVAQMEAAQLQAALATFDQIVKRRPAFAEGWNKRATLYYLLGEHQKSLRDCDEVFKRNPRHFGALSGAGQIHLQMGNLAQALQFFRRAVAVNPNLEGPAQMIPLIEQRLRDDPNRT